MRYATIPLLFCALTATATATVSQQDTSDCNPVRLLDQQEGVLEPADFNNALFDEGISHCSQEEMGKIIKALILSYNATREASNNYSDGVKRTTKKLAAFTNGLIDDYKMLYEQNRALKDLLQQTIKLYKENRALEKRQGWRRFMRGLQRSLETFSSQQPSRALACRIVSFGTIVAIQCLEQ